MFLDNNRRGSLDSMDNPKELKNIEKGASVGSGEISLPSSHKLEVCF